MLLGTVPYRLSTTYLLLKFYLVLREADQSPFSTLDSGITTKTPDFFYDNEITSHRKTNNTPTSWRMELAFECGEIGWPLCQRLFPAQSIAQSITLMQSTGEALPRVHWPSNGWLWHRAALIRKQAYQFTSSCIQITWTFQSHLWLFAS